MKHTPLTIGRLIRTTRKNQRLTQSALALTSGTGLRFIIDLEKGKPSCQFGKVLTVLHTLGIRIAFEMPFDYEAVSGDGSGSAPGAGNADGSGWGY